MERELLLELLRQKTILMDRVLKASTQIWREIQTDGELEIDRYLSDQKDARARIEKCDVQIGVILLESGGKEPIKALLSGGRAPADAFEAEVFGRAKAYREKLVLAREYGEKISAAMQNRYQALRNKLNDIRRRANGR